MVSYEQAGKMLDEAVEALPEGIFDGLNGGVNLLPQAKRDGRGSYILGLYHHDLMGRYIEIFYGSFAELYGDIPPEQFSRRLRSTLHHELTHHVEGLAGDRSLEHWDEEQELLWQELDEEGIAMDSLLFIDDDDTSLAPAAKALFGMYAAQRCPDIPVESAGLFSAGEALQPDCRAAAEALGADFSGHECKLLSEELFESFDAVVCMTLAQMDELLDRFPGSESKLTCADDTDILRPRLKLGWKKCAARINAMADEQTLALQSEGGEEDIRVERLDAGAPGYITAAIAQLEKENFSAPWTEEMLRRALGREDHIFFAALDGESVLGYIGAQLIVDELDIFNVAVDAAFRRRHIGERLVERLCLAAWDMKREMPMERITLEVRAGNAPAIALYEKQGFVQVGRRKNYYEKPREDAVLMDKVID